MIAIEQLVDCHRYPINRPNSEKWKSLAVESKTKLAQHGLFNLPEFLKPEAVQAAVMEVNHLLTTASFTHERLHNVYFKKTVDDLPQNHPALQLAKTVNHTVCADQIINSILTRLYEWPDFAQFLASVMEKPELHTMDDPLARINVMAYREGDALNWHFDRSEFTTTLLLQSPQAGGEFEYAKDLRSDANPNYDSVAKLHSGEIETNLMPLQAGTLNVFRGRNTAHRVSPVSGSIDRIIAVFSYFEEPGVSFSVQDRLGFYGRAT